MTEPADQLHHNNTPAHSYSSHEGFFGKASHHPGLSGPPTAQIWLPATSGFSQAKIAIERDEICECDGHTVHRLS